MTWLKDGTAFIHEDFTPPVKVSTGGKGFEGFFEVELFGAANFLVIV